ncbi:hypothetical protein R3P38DRAFT_2550125 [Favolaschia claudopus]|uniref:Uncharacterized protein n=1 Tax=Favolaschia claudopus TaxID=2862362 RepID=A0AAW0AIG3_9AGAR
MLNRALLRQRLPTSNLHPPSRHDLGHMNDRCPTRGALHWVAEHSRSPYGMCCNHGMVALQRLEEPPEPLHCFFVGNDAQAVDSRQQYSCAPQIYWVFRRTDISSRRM